MFYLPGPAVSVDIHSSNHPAGHQRGDGWLAAPIGWEDRQRQTLFFLKCERARTTVKLCSAGRQNAVTVLCIRDPYRLQQREREPQNSSCLNLHKFAAKHLIYLYLPQCYATHRNWIEFVELYLWWIKTMRWSQVDIRTSNWPQMTQNTRSRPVCPGDIYHFVEQVYSFSTSRAGVDTKSHAPYQM